jgi:hypothetical protein
VLTPEHAKLSKLLLGNRSLGIGIQKEIDANSQRFPGIHRNFDHEFERLGHIANKYGQLGELEIAIHIAADYHWFPEWEELLKQKHHKK